MLEKGHLLESCKMTMEFEWRQDGLTVLQSVVETSGYTHALDKMPKQVKSTYFVAILLLEALLLADEKQHFGICVKKNNSLFEYLRKQVHADWAVDLAGKRKDTGADFLFSICGKTSSGGDRIYLKKRCLTPSNITIICNGHDITKIPEGLGILKRACWSVRDKDEKRTEEDRKEFARLTEQWRDLESHLFRPVSKKIIMPSDVLNKLYVSSGELCKPSQEIIPPETRLDRPLKMAEYSLVVIGEILEAWEFERLVRDNLNIEIELVKRHWHDGILTELDTGKLDLAIYTTVSVKTFIEQYRNQHDHAFCGVKEVCHIGYSMNGENFYVLVSKNFRKIDRRKNLVDQLQGVTIEAPHSDMLGNLLLLISPLEDAKFILNMSFDETVKAIEAKLNATVEIGPAVFDLDEVERSTNTLFLGSTNTRLLNECRHQCKELLTFDDAHDFPQKQSYLRERGAVSLVAGRNLADERLHKALAALVREAKECARVNYQNPRECASIFHKLEENCLSDMRIDPGEKVHIITKSTEMSHQWSIAKDFLS